MYCPNCGNRNRDDARFCGNCATRLVPPDVPDPAGPPPSPPRPGDTVTTQAYPPGYLSRSPFSPAPPPANPAGSTPAGPQASGYPPPFASGEPAAYPYGAAPATGAPFLRVGIRQITALTGSALLLVSLLCPVEIRGDEYINYWNTAEGKAIALLGLLCIAVAAASAVRSLPSWTIMGVWVGAGGALAVTIYNLLQVHSTLPSDISLGWGWIVALLGALVVVIAPLIPEATPAQRGPIAIR